MYRACPLRTPGGVLQSKPYERNSHYTTVFRKLVKTIMWAQKYMQDKLLTNLTKNLLFPLAIRFILKRNDVLTSVFFSLTKWNFKSRSVLPIQLPLISTGHRTGIQLTMTFQIKNRRKVISTGLTKAIAGLYTLRPPHCCWLFQDIPGNNKSYFHASLNPLPPKYDSVTAWWRTD